jgi:DNA-binding NarL/FixJ family response regulator
MRRTVVLVSRDAKVRSALKSLRGPELAVAETASGLGALFTCAARPVDLLVIDVETPGMHWPTLLEKLSTAFPALAILTLSGRRDGETLLTVVNERLESAVSRKEPGRACVAVAQFAERRGA